MIAVYINLFFYDIALFMIWFNSAYYLLGRWFVIPNVIILLTIPVNLYKYFFNDCHFVATF